MKIQKYSKQELISLFKDLAQKVGATPTKKQWNEAANTPSDMVIRCQFGRWNEFVEACGFERYQPHLTELAQQNRNKAKRGKRSTNWKGGRITDKWGYIQIWMPEHPNSKGGGYIHEHRLVMSEKIGRPLVKGENVHHIDGARDNNEPKNLELWTTSQPSGQRVEDKIEWAINFLRGHGYETIKN